MEKGFFEKGWKALGTDISVQIVGTGLQKIGMEHLFAEIADIYIQQEKIFSRFDAQSELSAINSNLGKFVEVSPDMLQVVKKSLVYFRESAGFFDPRILETLEKIGYDKSFSKNNFSLDDKGSIIEEKNGKVDLRHDLIIEDSKVKFLRRMDFSGIAKGYITDKAAAFLRERGFENFLADSGGDMFAAGYDGDGDAWGIALEGSKNEEEVILEISNQAVATSGNVRRNWKRSGKRFHHLVNPHQPNDFSFAAQSVTVVEESVEKADVWAKTLFLLGQEKGLAEADRRKIKAYFLQLDGSIIKSKYA